MKKVLVGAMALLTLAACSNEEVLQKNEVNQEIGFTAVTGKALSRAADGYCNNEKPGDFLVWANVPDGSSDYKKYFSGDKFIQDGTVWKNDGAVRYWPYSAINFFAVKNAGNNVDWNTDNTTIVVKDFIVKNLAKDQVDFIYAVANVATKPTTGQTELNFRHALSQIEFNAQNKNDKLYVEIQGVSVCKVDDQGTFTLPTLATSDKVGDHNDGTYDDNVATKVQGSWDLGTSSYSTFSVTTKKVEADGTETDEVKKIPGNSSVVSLTVTDATSPAKEYNSQTLYLLPQTTTAWVPSATAPKPAAQDGTYFLVKCKIYNVADPAHGYQSTDVRIWPKEEGAYADVAIPFAANWEQGKRYVYTFVFTTDGTGGYNPDPTGPSKPEEVLVPIKLDITVDDFVKGEDKDVEMKK